MAIGVLFEIPGGTQEHYDEIRRRLFPDNHLIDGNLFHVAGPTSTGWRAVDCWESEEKFEAFAARLVPVAQEIGMPLAEPQFFPAYNVMTD